MVTRDRVFQEICHETNCVVGWVRFSPGDPSKWVWFGRSISRITAFLSSENVEVSEGDLRGLFFEFIFPVVKAWVDDPDGDYMGALDDAYYRVADKVLTEAVG